MGKEYIVNTNPTKIVGGVPLGPNFWEVNVQEALDPNYLLVKRTKYLQTIGDAIGENDAWLSHDISNCYV